MANETEALIEEMVQALRSVMKKAHETGNCGVCGGNDSADDCDNDECPIAKVRAALAAYEQTLEGATKRKSDRLAPSATTGEEKEDGERDEGYRQLRNEQRSGK